MRLSRSAHLYTERAGLAETYRSPTPRLAPGLNAVLNVPVSVPLPNPEFLYENNGNPPPDRGLTRVWPHADSETPQ